MIGKKKRDLTNQVSKDIDPCSAQMQVNHLGLLVWGQGGYILNISYNLLDEG